MSITEYRMHQKLMMCDEEPPLEQFLFDSICLASNNHRVGFRPITGTAENADKYCPSFPNHKRYI